MLLLIICNMNAMYKNVTNILLFSLHIFPGMGPMPWTVNAEIYPMWARGTASSISTCTNWLFNFIVSITFLTLTESLTRMGRWNIGILA